MKVKLTQEAINRLGYLPAIAEDGILGHRETLPALDKLGKMLKTLFEKKHYEILKHNLVGIRFDNILDNMFTDIYAFWDRDKPKNTRLFPCSVNPGLYGKGSALEPIWNAGLFGVAILKEGQYQKAYSLQGPWWSGKEFLYQIKPVTVYRDSTKDKHLDRMQEQTGLFGINHHSWLGFRGNNVNNLSQGCQVFRSDIHDLIVPYWQYLANTQHNQISYTLVHKDTLDITAK